MSSIQTTADSYDVTDVVTPVDSRVALRSQLRDLRTDHALYSSKYKTGYALKTLKDAACDTVRDAMYMWGSSSVFASIATGHLVMGETALASLLFASYFHLSYWFTEIKPTLTSYRPSSTELDQMAHSASVLEAELAGLSYSKK